MGPSCYTDQSIMVTTAPISASLKHAPACSRVSLLKSERHRAFAPFQIGKTSPNHRTHRKQACRTRAEATAASQATARLRPELRNSTSQRPLSLTHNDQQQTDESQGDAAETGVLGKRVVIVGGGWAGKLQRPRALLLTGRVFCCFSTC